MALKHGDKHFCMFTFNENGKPFHRRVHEMTVQAERVFRIEGANLPNEITVHTGTSSTGHNVAEIICDPLQRSRGRYTLPSCDAWFRFRDFVNFGLGFFAFVIFRFVVGLFMAI